MKRALERRLADIEGFRDPDLDREQYPTPADVAAYLVHLADLRGDLAGHTVVDLGTGTGVLALGAATRGPARVLALDVDARALAVARENERRIAPTVAVDWLQADATRAPLCPDCAVTVLANPPFGAQRGNRNADRAFLETAAEIAAVSYTIHNEGSRDFVAAFARDHGGDVTDAYRATLPLERQFDHQTAERVELDAEVYRIEWR